MTGNNISLIYIDTFDSNETCWPSLDRIIDRMASISETRGAVATNGFITFCSKDVGAGRLTIPTVGRVIVLEDIF